MNLGLSDSLILTSAVLHGLMRRLDIIKHTAYEGALLAESLVNLFVMACLC